MTWDVIVAGAGPAGSAAARMCAEAGLATLCIEEHGTIGYPVQCAGLLSLAAFDECRVSQRPVTNTVTGARIITGGGSELSIDARIPKAHVVDRGILDREMAAAAAEAGAVFRLKTQVCGVRGRHVLTRGINGHEEHQFRLLIAADGPRSTIARSLGMNRAKVYLAGIQAEGAYDCDSGLVELHPDASPEFFGWVIPAGDGRVRVGLCGKTGVKERFLSFIRTLGLRSDLHLVTGTLPLGVMPRTYGQHTLFIGDAAGFAKPTSGGGIYTGVRTARHAADVAIACCEHDSFSDRALSAYEDRWQADIGRELALGFRLFLMRQEMSPATTDGLIRALNDPAIRDTIIQHGDMDRPAALVRLLIKKPALLRYLSPLLVSGIRSYF
jgi:geranylgeranyl reductase family protein